MIAQLQVLSAGPSVTIQDLGWTGTLSYGLSRGGAADTLALLKAAALLNHPPESAALELAGYGGVFTVTSDTQIALTGAPMAATLDDVPLVWNASHPIRAGQKLALAAVRQGVYGYLSIRGGLKTRSVFGSRATHTTAGIGSRIEAGDRLPFEIPSDPLPSRKLPPANRFEEGDVRLLPSAQTALFSAETIERFTGTTFRRSPQANRQGVKLDFEGVAFTTDDQLSLLSEVVMPGDIQMAGDGAPYILMPDCQTTGGYPRIGTVLPDDLPKIAQAPIGAELRFSFLTHEEAMEVHVPNQTLLERLKNQVTPLTRDPRDIPDLLSYNLIDGVVSGREA